MAMFWLLAHSYATTHVYCIVSAWVNAQHICRSSVAYACAYPCLCMFVRIFTAGPVNSKQWRILSGAQGVINVIVFDVSDRTFFFLDWDALVAYDTIGLGAWHADQEWGVSIQHSRVSSKLSRTYIHMLSCMLVCVRCVVVVFFFFFFLEVWQCEAKDHFLWTRLIEHPCAPLAHWPTGRCGF